MKEMEGTIRTALATMRMIGPGLLEQRIHPDAVLNIEGLRSTREAREVLCANEPCAVLCIIPPTVRSDFSTGTEDHFRSEREKSTISALALVAQGEQMEAVSKAYFTFYPQGFRLKVFSDERDARKWLKDQMEEVVREGR